jgi:hypothetical protein
MNFIHGAGYLLRKMDRSLAGNWLAYGLLLNDTTIEIVDSPRFQGYPDPYPGMVAVPGRRRLVIVLWPAGGAEPLIVNWWNEFTVQWQSSRPDLARRWHLALEYDFEPQVLTFGKFAFKSGLSGGAYVPPPGQVVYVESNPTVQDGSFYQLQAAWSNILAQSPYSAVMSLYSPFVDVDTPQGDLYITMPKGMDDITPGVVNVFKYAQSYTQEPFY